MKDLPIIINCKATRHKIINQIIFEEFIKDKNKWCSRARDKLKGYGVNISTGTLSSYRRKLSEGERDPSTVSLYGGGSSNHLTSRHGKDGMYLQFKLWCDIFTEEPSYVGLPANQILAISKDFGPERVVACEKNKDRFEYMKKLQTHFAETPYATIKNIDIFKFLMATSLRFSIYDFDLMCNINENVVEKIAKTVSKTCMEKTSINIATTIGRNITEKQHQEIVPRKVIEALEDYDLEVVRYYCNGYNDRAIPMRYIFLATESK